MDRNGNGFADEEALTWLLRQPTGKVETSLAELARQWGWTRTKVSRRLKRWSDEGRFIREIGPGGKSLITSVRHAVTESPRTLSFPVPAPNAFTQAVSVKTSARRKEPIVFAAAPLQRGRIGLNRLGGLVLAVLAVAIAYHGLKINAWYGWTLGKTTEASTLLSGLSVAADGLALVLPATACALWRERPLQALAAWGVWALTIAVALLASVGFAAVNIADTTAARSKIASESTSLTMRVERLRSERAGIAEPRSVETIAAEIQRAQPSAAPVWRATSGCTDVTRPESGEACGAVLKLRQALGTAKRRDALEAELADAEARLASLPAVSTADPQAETAARLVDWLSGALIGPTPADVQMARVLGMTLLPQVSGLVFMLAMAMWQPTRRPGDGEAFEQEIGAA